MTRWKKVHLLHSENYQSHRPNWLFKTAKNDADVLNDHVNGWDGSGMLKEVWQQQMPGYQVAGPNGWMQANG